MTERSINPNQFLEDLDQLNDFGRLANGGVERIAFTEADQAARGWLRGRLGELPVQIRTDPAGNTIARLDGRSPDLPPIAIGSHTDTVPNGGRLDGALGVIAGLACLRALAGPEPVTEHPIELINFAAEEATVTAGTFGSRAMAGLLEEREIREAGFDPESIAGAGRSAGALAAFLELHIEQGSELERGGKDIGLVEGIAALQRCTFRIRGTSAHAGSTPMNRRDDALRKAAAFVQDVHREATRLGARATIGQLEVENGAPAVVPAAVTGTLDLRTATDERLDELERAFPSPDIHFSSRTRKPAAPSDAALLGALEEACAAVGAASMRLTSFAGHDARSMASLGPMAMLFVPSRGGVSHSPDEFTTPEQCVTGARTLLAAVRNADRRSRHDSG